MRAPRPKQAGFLPSSDLAEINPTRNLLHVCQGAGCDSQPNGQQSLLPAACAVLEDMWTFLFGFIASRGGWACVAAQTLFSALLTGEEILPAELRLQFCRDWLSGLCQLGSPAAS